MIALNCHQNFCKLMNICLSLRKFIGKTQTFWWKSNLLVILNLFVEKVSRFEHSADANPQFGRGSTAGRPHTSRLSLSTNCSALCILRSYIWRNSGHFVKNRHPLLYNVCTTVPVDGPNTPWLYTVRTVFCSIITVLSL